MRIAIPLALLSALLVALPLAADVIKTKDGKTYEGEVTKRERSRIYLKLKVGGVWVQKTNIKSHENKPVPWKTADGDVDASRGSALDFNRVLRVTFYLARKYSPDLMGRVWSDAPMTASLMADLEASRATGFSSEISELDGMAYPALARNQLKAAEKRHEYLMKRTIARAQAAKLLPRKMKKRTPDEIKKAISDWFYSTPEGKRGDKGETARLLLNRIAVLQNRLKAVERLSPKGKLEEKVERDVDYIKSYFGSIRGGLIPAMQEALGKIENERGWETRIHLTGDGVRRMGKTLQGIALRTRHERVDGEYVRWDPRFFNGPFRFFVNKESGFPQVLHRYRYLYADQVVCDYYLIRIDGRPNYGVLVRDRDIWYAVVNLD